VTGLVVIGAGEGGLRVARSCRQEGFAGAITVFGAEALAPYSRPPLSKRALTADMPFRALIDDAALADERIDVVLGNAVVSVDTTAKSVTTADGVAHSYGSLVFATGALPRQLTTPGAAEAGIFYLRTWGDSMALKAAFQPGARVVVVGAGFIGLELAAAAIKLGAIVTVIEFLPRVLGRAVPETLAADVAARHRSEGVSLLLGRVIERFTRTDAGTAVSLDGGDVVMADVVVAGIGAQPDTSVAEAAGLTIDNGIAVDGFLRSSAIDVYAIGDACSYPHPLYGNRRIRLEAWRNATEQGHYVASVITKSAVEPYSGVPWFWSDQYDGVLQVSGLSDEGVTVVERPFSGARVLFHLAADGRMVAVSSWGTNKSVAKDVRIGEMLIAASAKPEPMSLADPNVTMKSLLPDRSAP
jgi:3-phenylpropionate/trans-cinnamate dioxygenase ferredoxin reductase component